MNDEQTQDYERTIRLMGWIELVYELEDQAGAAGAGEAGAYAKVRLVRRELIARGKT